MADPTLTSGMGGQYSIGYPGNANAFVYGNGANGIYVQDTQTDTGSVTTQDQAVVGRDGMQFGVDTLPGMVITQTGFARLANNPPAAMDAYSSLAGAWNDPTIRLVNGSIQVLRAKYPGSNVTRRCYGRGRKIMPALGMSNQGVVPWTAQFQAADNTWYEDTISTLLLTMVPVVLGGLAPPWTPPFQIAAVGNAANTAANTGSLPTWPVFTFSGPSSGAITNPVCTFVNTPISIGYLGSLKPLDTLIIDTRPWACTALLNGTSVAGLLTGTAMVNLVLMPGATALSFTGQDYSGTATLKVDWRNATDFIGGSV